MRKALFGFILLTVLTPLSSYSGADPAPVGTTEPCFDCGYGCAHPDYHDDEEGGVFLGFSAGNHVNYCSWTVCYFAHLFDCYGSLDETELDTIEQLIENGQTASIAMLVVGLSQVEYDPARNAVQIRGCSGSIVASFPLREAAGIRVASLLRANALGE